MWVGDNTLDLGEYYTKEEGEQFESDIDNRVTSVEDELSSVAQGSPKGVYATLSDLENAYPTGTAGIYVVQADGHWYYWNGSAWADGGAYFSAENVVSHSENQLKDSQGNNMFPLINAESIQEGTIDVNMLNNTLVKNSDNILKIKSYDGNAFTDNIASFDFETNKLVINGTTTSSAKNVNLYSTKNGEYNYMLLKAGTYYLHTSQQLPTYFFNVNLFTIKNKQVTTTLSVYSNKDWSFTLSEDTYLFRIQIVLQANTTFSFDGYIWLNYEENKPYSSPNKIAVTPDYLEEKLTPIEDELNVINEQLNPSVKPTIMFIFDSAAYDNRAQILETNGFRGTFDFGFDETSGSLGFNDLKRLITNGHDIGLYYGGGTNPAPSYDSDTWDTYISNGIECLNERGFFKPTVYGCKGLVSNNKIEESCEKNDIIYISSASIQTGASSYDYPTIASNSPFSKYLKPFTMHQHTLQEALETIDLAVSNNYILPLFCHKADGSNDGITEAHFIAVVNKVKTLYDNGLVDVLTYRGLYNKYNKENGKERDYNREMSAIMKLYADKY